MTNLLLELTNLTTNLPRLLDASRAEADESRILNFCTVTPWFSNRTLLWYSSKLRPREAT